MSFLVRGRASRDIGDPGQPLIPARIGSPLNPSGRVPVDMALTLSAVWRAVSLRADLISTTPLGAFRKAGGSKVDIPTPTVLTNPGGDRVDICEWLYSSQVSLDLRGNAYGQIVGRDGLGYPKQIELLPPDSVGVSKDRQSGALIYRVDGKIVDQHDMWHERAYTFPGSPVGLSPLSYAARTVGLGLGAAGFGSRWFIDAVNPSGVLTSDQPITPDQARTMKARIVEAWGNSREPAVLGSGLSWQPLSVKPEESQFLATIGANGADIARFFGLAPEMIGFKSGDSQTYQNNEQRGLDFRVYSIGPTFVRRENALSAGLMPRPQYVRFDLDSLNRADLLTRWKAHIISIAGHVRPPSEVRNDEDLPPLTAEQLAEFDPIPLTITPNGGAKALPPQATPAPDTEPDPDADPTED